MPRTITINPDRMTLQQCKTAAHLIKTGKLVLIEGATYEYKP